MGVAVRSYRSPASAGLDAWKVRLDDYELEAAS